MLGTKPVKYLIKTYGCAANVADSHKLSSMLSSLGFVETDKFSDCDIFIANSCSVRQKSEDKIYGLARKLLKKRKKQPFVVLTGCVVGSAMGDRKRHDMASLEKKTPWVNLYIPPWEIFKIPEMLKEAGFTTHKMNTELDSTCSYVNISYGCDNFCSYCVVPYARGEEVSRSRDEILKEVKKLIKNGVTNITLCGQNVNSWGLDKKTKFKIRVGSNQKLPFADLLRGVCAVSGAERVEFLSSNPFDFTSDLIKTLNLPQISDYLHIAVQSGNNDVLKAMNRRHTVEEFISLIDSIKKVRPDMRFGTDVIVGFPNETWEQFLDTVKLFQKIKFDVAYISMYSERKGTKAAEMYEDNVPLAEKRKRHAYLTKVWEESKL